MLESKIYSSFKIEGKVIECKKHGKGNINDTYLLKTNTNKYIIQTINKNVFKNPKKLMKNIYTVTTYLKENNQDYKGIKIIKTNKNKLYYKKNNKYYRCYEYIDDCDSVFVTNDLELVYEMGKAVGNFDKSLLNLNKNKLFPIIPNFHNQSQRYKNFKKIEKKDKYNLKHKVIKEINFIKKRKKYFYIINKLIKNKKINITPIHNDPKYNNILVDSINKKYICLIDLDTVMPGTILYDYGDAIRSIILSCEEDERNLNNVKIDIDKLVKFTEGFLLEVNDIISKEEKELLYYSIIIITLECGTRFLTDYLDNNKYFKVLDKEHNLRRAKVAFKEVILLEKNKNKIINSILK